MKLAQENVSKLVLYHNSTFSSPIIDQSVKTLILDPAHMHVNLLIPTVIMV